MTTRLRDFAMAALLAVPHALLPLQAALDPADWPLQLPIETPRQGWVRVELPVESLARTRPDRSDLRVVGPDGREVPWRLYRAGGGDPRQAALEAGSITSRIEGRRSILEFDTRTDRVLSGLLLVTPAAGFFKAATLEATQGQGWERIVSGVPVYQDYRGATDLRLDFVPGAWTRLRLILDDRRSPPIPVRSVVLLATTGAPVEVTSMAVALRARSEEPGRTRLQVDLGAAGLDVAWIELDTPEPLFTRPVRILAERVAGDALQVAELGRSVVHRLPGDAATAEDNRRIRVERNIPTREIVLEIENGDSPPLAVGALRVGLHAQRLEFWSAGSGVYRLLGGNGFASVPQYDISRLLLPAELGVITVVAREPWTANPGYREPGVGHASLGVGAVFEPKGWRHHRTLRVGGAGTVELELPPDVIAASRSDLGDLRIVRDGRHVPYVIDPQGLWRRLPLTVSVEPVGAKSRRSLLRLDSAGSHAPAAVVRLDTPQAAFVRLVRWFEVRQTRDGRRWTNELAAAEWRRVPGAVVQPLQLIPGRRPEGGTTWVEIDDGDNPPLPGLTAQAEYETRRLLFLSIDDGAMELHYGNPDAAPPRYDLALLADRLNASSRTAASLGPDAVRGSIWGEAVVSGPALQIVFWAVLGVVVVVLFAVIRRMLPEAPGGH
jgi:hypothetical protein